MEERENAMPVGLGFGLAMNEKAMSRFSDMTDAEKRQVIEAARGVSSKQEMQSLVENIADIEKFS